MGSNAARWIGAGLAFFFEYDTFKVVHIRSVTLGVVNRVLQAVVLGFVIGYIIVYEKGYQTFDAPVSSVTTKVKGVGYANLSSGIKIYDVPDYVVPPQMKDSFFVMTNAIVTPRQVQANCPEDPNIPGVICTDDPSVCQYGVRDMLGNGVQTGRCVDSDQRNNTKVCEVKAWCPVEIDITPQTPLLEEAENFTVLIKNSVTFPAFNIRRRNILDTQNSSFLRQCEYKEDDDQLKLCPVFRLGTIVKQAGMNFEEVAVDGAVVSISIIWNCDFDHSVENCVPVYKFARLDEPSPKIAPGFNFRYANYWSNESGTELRTMYKVYGIMFIVQVQGKGGKFDPIPLATNLGSGLALLTIVTIVCDVLLLYCVKMKDFYRKKKYLIVNGDDAFTSQALVGNEESVVESASHRHESNGDSDDDVPSQVEDNIKILPRNRSQKASSEPGSSRAVNASSTFIGLEQLGAKLGVMNAFISDEIVRQEGSHLSFQPSPCRKSSLSTRRSSSNLSSKTGFRLGTRLFNLNAVSQGGGAIPSHSMHNGHRLSADFSKRAVINNSGSLRTRRSVDDHQVLKKASSSHQLNRSTNNQNGNATECFSNQSIPLRRVASAQNLVGAVAGNGHLGVQRKSSANAAMAYNAELLATFESEKKQLEHRISELTQLTEKRKSEIERYKIEIRQMGESLADHVKIQEENNTIKAENRALRDKLREISGGAFEQLTDTEKLSLLQQHSSSSSCTPATAVADPNNGGGSGGSECGRTVHTPEHGSSCFSSDVRGVFGGGHSIISGDTWDRHSCKSGAESDVPSAISSNFVPNQNGCNGKNGAPVADVANLRDRIAMMEETNYSTNEELQATVQELVEMQKTVNELQEENERLADERAVLLASLCAQTQKLENCRSSIEHLKALLLSDGDSVDRSEYEQQLTELVKRGEEERDELLLRQAELSNALAASEYDLREIADINAQLRDHLADRELKLAQFETDRRLLNEKLKNVVDELQTKDAELERCRNLMEAERSRLLNDCGMASSNDAPSMESIQSDKVLMEVKLTDLEERLALSNRELSRVRDQLLSSQATAAELDARLVLVLKERTSFEQELLTSQQQLDHISRSAENSQSELAALKIRLDGALRRINELENELTDARRRHAEDAEEWRQFQRDLQMAVVVANNMCVETKENFDRLLEENTSLQEQHRQISQERTRLVEENTRLRASTAQHTSSSERDLSTAATIQRIRAVSSSSSAVSSAIGSQQLSVKSLIRSIESQVKTGGTTSPNNAAAAAAVAAAALLSSHHQIPVSNLGGSPRRPISGDPVSLNSHAGSPSGTASPIPMISGTRSSPANHISSTPDTIVQNSAISSIRGSIRKPASVIVDSNVNQAMNTAQSPSIKSTRAHSSNCGNNSASVAPLGNGIGVGSAVPSASPQFTTSIAAAESDASCCTVEVATASASRLTARAAVSDFTKDPLTLLAKQMGGSKRNALLKWVQNRTHGYNRIEVTNFSSSWADGLAFCALLHSYLPNIVPYAQLVADMDGSGSVLDRRRNFTVAFQAAESVGIPKLLDIDEMLATERPDWQRIMTYVTAIYKCFELPDFAST